MIIVVASRRTKFSAAPTRDKLALTPIATQHSNNLRGTGPNPKTGSIFDGYPQARQLALPYIWV